MILEFGVLQEFDDIIGLEEVKSHSIVNDSKNPQGSHKDAMLILFWNNRILACFERL